MSLQQVKLQFNTKLNSLAEEILGFFQNLNIGNNKKYFPKSIGDRVSIKSFQNSLKQHLEECRTNKELEITFDYYKSLFEPIAIDLRLKQIQLYKPASKMNPRTREPLRTQRNNNINSLTLQLRNATIHTRHASAKSTFNEMLRERVRQKRAQRASNKAASNKSVQKGRFTVKSSTFTPSSSQRLEDLPTSSREFNVKPAEFGLSPSGMSITRWSEDNNVTLLETAAGKRSKKKKKKRSKKRPRKSKK